MVEHERRLANQIGPVRADPSRQPPEALDHRRPNLVQLCPDQAGGDFPHAALQFGAAAQGPNVVAQPATEVEEHGRQQDRDQ